MAEVTRQGEMTHNWLPLAVVTRMIHQYCVLEYCNLRGHMRRVPVGAQSIPTNAVKLKIYLVPTIKQVVVGALESVGYVPRGQV